MKYLALYRKYRPTHFNELVGQEKVVKVLKNAIVNNKISHAYLFSGPRGTGKTTVAKLIAKLVNCENPLEGEPCDNCENCLAINNKLGEDIIEIDAASNNGVDEIRELRDKINLVPSKSKFKVYIIDEVHMLTIGAFNALLKTLEEPPAHVIFILATTEPHKVPVTVASRCQKFQFNKISIESIIKRIKTICEEEKINIEDDAVYEIARMADGALRDALTILDQLNAYNSEKITVNEVHEVIGSVSYLKISELLKAIINNNSKEIINFVETLDSEGKNINIFLEEMMFFIRDIILYRKISYDENIPKEKLEKIKEISESIDIKKLFDYIEVLNKLSISIKSSSYPIILIEVTLLELIKPDNEEIEKKGIEEKSNSVSNVEKIKKLEQKSEENKEEKEEITTNEENIKEKNNESLSTNVDNKEKKKDDKVKTSENIVQQNETLDLSKDEDFIKFKNVRINNTFATANKEILKTVQNDWKKLEELLIDKKDGIIAGILNDAKVVVAGEKNLILTVKTSSLADRLNLIIDEAETLTKKILDKNYYLITLSEEEWLQEKENYIKNMNAKIPYQLKEEVKYVPKKKIIKDEIKELINVLGEDIIEYK